VLDPIKREKGNVDNAVFDQYKGPGFSHGTLGR